MSHGFNIKKIFIFTTLCLCFSASFLKPSKDEIVNQENASTEVDLEENIIVENINSTDIDFIKKFLSSKEQVNNEKIGTLHKFLKTAGISTLSALTGFIWTVIRMSKEGRFPMSPQTQSEEIILIAGFGCFMLFEGIPVIIISNIIYTLIYDHLISKEDITYKTILNEYAKHWKLFKKHTPEKFHAKFNSLYSNYKANGKNLKINEQEAKDIINKILNKCKKDKKEENLETVIA